MTEILAIRVIQAIHAMPTIAQVLLFWEQRLIFRLNTIVFTTITMADNGCQFKWDVGAVIARQSLEGQQTWNSGKKQIKVSH